jgi:AraC family transcriptional regulator
MNRDKPGTPITVNATSNESVLKILPALPVASSQTSLWRGIQLAYHRHTAAFETPEHCFPQHFITIHRNSSAIVKERMLDGDFQSDRFRDGDICLTPATTPVSVRLHDACEVMHLYLEPTLMAQLTAEVADIDNLELIPQFKLNDSLIYQIGVALKAKLELGGVCDRLYTESMAMAISAHLINYYSTQDLKVRSYSNGLSQARLKQAIEYMHEHLTQNLSITEIAQTLQMSPYYFSRLFKQSTGLTPHQYLLKCRIDQAKRLLQTTDLSVATVATQVGFVDQSHLARHFKRQVGVLPNHFRTCGRNVLTNSKNLQDD